MKRKPRLWLYRFMACVCLAISASASAQTYPQKAIRILTAPVGGALDIAARTYIGPAISEGLHQPVIVENRQGLATIQAAAKSAPDGYTLLVHGSIVWLQQYMNQDTPWDPVRDFTSVSYVTSAPTVLVVVPSLPVNSVKELIAYAKARPGQLNYASGASGVISHLAGELFKSVTNTFIVRIPYGGTAEGLKAMMSGEVQLMFPAAASSMPMVRSGKMNALAIATLKPSPNYPGLPTMIQAGVPGFESGAGTYLYAPAKTPDAIINQLYGAVKMYLGKPDVVARLTKQGLDIIASSPAEMNELMKTSMPRLGKVVKDANIRDE